MFRIEQTVIYWISGGIVLSVDWRRDYGYFKTLNMNLNVK